MTPEAKLQELTERIRKGAKEMPGRPYVPDGQLPAPLPDAPLPPPAFTEPSEDEEPAT